ncbi:MAG TPA: MFS transporter [Anaeromyxobacteraceae bacterium]|nr:MFS transporter [Anaeromyxobacteraceae bacterium]
MPTPPARAPRPRLEVAALYVATVACYADMYLTQPVLPLLAREFGLTPAEAGLSISAVVVAIALASSFYGPLSDALGRKRVMVASALALVLPTAACAGARSFEALCVLRAVQGALIPGVTAVSIAYAGDRFERGRLPLVVSGIIAASVAGGLLGRVLGGLTASVAGWRVGFVLFGGVSLLAAALLGLGLAPSRRGAALGWAEAYAGMMRHLADRRLLGAFIIGATLFFGWCGIFTYLPFHLGEAPYRLGTAEVSAVYLVYLAGILVAPLAGRLSARVSARAVMGLGLSVAAAGMATTLFHPLPLVAAGLVVLCLGMFTAQAVAPAFVNTSARAAKGGASALYLTFYYVGGTLGSFLPGLAWQAWRWPGVVAVCAGSLAVALFADGLLCGPADGP